MEKAQYKTHLRPLLSLCDPRKQYKEPLRQAEKEKRLYTEDPSRMSVRESTVISYKRENKALLFPDDPILLQLQVVTGSAYTISIQTFLKTRIKLSYYRGRSDIDHGIHHIFALFSH